MIRLLATELPDTRFTLVEDSGIDVLVSLLTGTEADELGLTDERQACESAGIVFVSRKNRALKAL